MRPTEIDAEHSVPLKIHVNDLIEVRSAPLSLYPNYQIFWPKAPLVARCIPEGIMPLNREDGFEHETYLEEFWNKKPNNDMIIFALGDEQAGFYSGRYDADLRLWIKTEFIRTPVCIFSLSDNVCMIVDEQMRYSVIGGTPQAIMELEAIWGGAETLLADFVKYVDGNELGFGDEDKKWAHKYLIPWCWHHLS